MWNRQVHALLDGYELASHLDGSTPTQTIVADDTTSVNLAYTLWKRQDKLIYSALLGAISQTIQPLLSLTTASAEIWTTLASTYAKPSRGHIKQLQHQLKNWSKDTKSIDEYFQGLTTKFDQLGLLGKVIDHEDKIDFVLQGLPDEYKPVVDQTEGRDSPPSLTELHEKLLNHEAKLLSSAYSPSLPISANYAGSGNRSRPQSKNNHRSNHTWHNNNQQQSWNNSQTTNHNRNSRPYLGRCQICGVQGHSAKRCSQLHTVQQSPQRALLPTPPYPPSPWLPRANLATTPSWVVDSGATHHITSDLSNLSLHQPYTGGEEVIVGNGNGLPITRTGFTSLPSIHKSLSLHNVLCVPSIQKNLISVYRLCNVNQVSVEFSPTHFQVKDLTSGVPLLQGRTNKELYEWSISQPAAVALFATHTVKTSLSDWHLRLGHPSLSILQTIISKHSLPLSDTLSIKVFILC
uniref:Uncharacterized protein n=1 Tax=Noccaea caerulescens TaxID=107243 RepID=A0A1J3J5Y3_NOCCA